MPVERRELVYFIFRSVKGFWHALGSRVAISSRFFRNCEGNGIGMFSFYPCEDDRGVYTMGTWELGVGDWVSRGGSLGWVFLRVPALVPAIWA